MGDYDDIVKTFRSYRTVFPYLRPKELEKSIKIKNMVWCDGVAIQFKTYKRRQKKGTFTTKVGDIHLQKIASSKRGATDRVFTKWLDHLGDGRIVLSVRQDNKRAIKFYEKHNFEIVSKCRWTDTKGYVMVLEF